MRKYNKKVPVKTAKDSYVETLKKQIRRLEKDKRELISKLKTLERDFEKTCNVMKEKVDPYTLEEVMKMVQDAEKRKK